MNNRQEDQKNVILAIILATMVLLGWQFFYAQPKLKEEQDRRQREQAALVESQKKAAPGTEAGKGPVIPGTTPARPGDPAALRPLETPEATREKSLAISPRVAIETPALKGTIALKGGRIDDLLLLRYRDTVQPTSPNVVLFSPAGAPEPFYADYGWVVVSGNAKVPDESSLWTVEKGPTLTPTTPLTLVWDNGEGLIFRRTISIDQNYLFTVRQDVENKGTAAVQLRPYGLLYRVGPKGKLSAQGIYFLHEGFIGVLAKNEFKEIYYETPLKDPRNKLQTFEQDKGWLGMTDKYWSAALVPSQTQRFEASLRGELTPASPQREVFQTTFAEGAATIAPGQSATVTTHLFAGARNGRIIENYSTQLTAPKFDLLYDWGWFYFITKPLYFLLDWLRNLLGGFGLAILAVTVLVKAVFFPLANKSYESMSRMKKLQPQMEALRERFKDDRAAQQKELMELYKKEKINPAAGCLPIVLQIPVFFALYKVIYGAIDMRHAPFYGWIKDLAAPDPTSIFNLFGLLPFMVPEFLQIGAWPILMGITMWVQMQLNPQQPDPVQQQIFNLMPIMFTFLLASFPVGLIIYWAWSNVLSIAQQWYIMKKNGVEVHLGKNMGLHKLKGWLSNNGREKV